MALIDVVKWDAPGDELVWKFPGGDLSTATRLIVSTAQEAVVVLGGEISGVFGPGTHVLDTQNIPLLRHLIKIPFGGQTPYSAEVWFVQKTTPLNLLWGTQDPVQLLDPRFNVPVPIRCYGQFGIRIGDSKLFLEKLVGTRDRFDTAMLVEYFKAMVQTRVKTLIAGAIVRSNCSVFEINLHLEELSGSLEQLMAPGFASFGVELVNFFVQSINFPQDDPAVVSLRESLAKRADMSILGYNYTQERSLDILQSAAANEGTAGAFAGAGLGFGMGTALSGSVSSAFTQVAGDALHLENPGIGAPEGCPQCGNVLPGGAKFCPECGAPRRLSCCGKELPPGAKFCPECGKEIRKV